MKPLQIAITGLLLSFPTLLHAGCCEHELPEQTYRHARAVGEFRVDSAESHRDATGRIRTLYRLSLNASLKSECPARIEWDLPGGLLDNELESSSLNPGWQAGEDHILHLQQHDDGRWTPLPFRALKNTGSPAQRKALRDFVKNGARGRVPVVPASKPPASDSGEGNSGVPGSRITATGYFESAGVPSRFIACDSGASIPCIVDIDPSKLPAGVNTAGALQIVENVLAAWSSASSLKFKITGTINFGVGADNINASDRTLRIQLHDNHNRIPNTATLGIGGGAWTLDPGLGATIAGRTFNRRSSGYVVMNHRAPSLSNAMNFAEVLTHEIGHALGLTHSSESSTESDAILKNATMYYMLSGDGRGAGIKLYDQDRIAFGYPLNTPPSSLDRILRVVTGSPQPTGPGVNRVTLTAFDLQTPAGLTLALLPGTPSAFTLTGNTLSYASPVFSDSQLSNAQIEGGSFYEIAFFQVSDGVNLSPKHKLVITGHHYDSHPSDGLPDSWLSTYFGTITPGAVGSPRHPDSDPDGDGLDNRTERYLGTHPLQASSGLPKLSYNRATGTLSFTPLRFAPHLIQSSATLGNWTNLQALGTFSASSATLIDVSNDAPAAKMFYRLNVTP